jgi:hypothetical protein
VRGGGADQTGLVGIPFAQLVSATLMYSRLSTIHDKLCFCIVFCFVNHIQNNYQLQKCILFQSFQTCCIQLNFEEIEFDLI